MTGGVGGRATLLLPALVLGTAPGPARAAPQGVGDTVATAVYEVAGVRVIHRFTPESEIVAARVYLLGGTRQATRETAGIEALLLGAGETASRRALAKQGATSFVWAGADWSVTGLVALRKTFAAAWTAFAGRFDSTALDEGAIEGARDRLLSAARRRHTHPELRIRVLAREAMFQDHPYALDPEGTEETLDALTVQDVGRYLAEQLVRTRLLVVVVGAVPRAEVDSLVTETFGGLPRGSYRWTPPPPVPKWKPEWVVEHRELATNYILGYFVGPPRTDRDYFAFEVAVNLLSSLIGSAVRTEQSLSYAAYAPFLDDAIPVGGVYASTPDPARAYETMIDQMDQLRQFELPLWVLRDFQDHFTIDRALEQMTNEGQAEALGRTELLFGNYRMAEESWRRLARVHSEQVQRAALKYFQDLRLVYLGDSRLMGGKWGLKPR